MKTPNENHESPAPDWMRWLDGEMPAADRAAFEQRLAADPGLQSEVDSARHLSHLLKKGLPAEMEVPHGDFFNSQIQVRLAQMDLQESRDVPSPARASWIGWLRMPWLIGAAAAVITVLLLRHDSGTGVSSSDTLVMSTYAPNPKVVVSAFHSDAAEATVLMLEGLEELPPERKVVGLRLQSGGPDAESLTTAFRGESGQIEVVMTRDARNQPKLWVPRS
jgi:hypothetical protein